MKPGRIQIAFLLASLIYGGLMVYNHGLREQVMALKRLASGASMSQGDRPGADAVYKPLTFKYLSGFEIKQKAGERTDTPPSIPADIKALDRTAVSVSGFMMPVHMDGDRVASFILTPNQMLCCYGVQPRLNEWIYVDMGQSWPVVMDRPITVYGTLFTTPDIVKGRLISLYRLHGDVLVAKE